MYEININRIKMKLKRATVECLAGIFSAEHLNKEYFELELYMSKYFTAFKQPITMLPVFKSKTKQHVSSWGSPMFN